LNPGDTFLYREHLEGGKERIRFGRCYGRVKPLVSLGGEKTIWHVLALVASDRMTGAYERWIEPKDVIETVPEKYTNPLIRSWFDEQEYWRDQDKH
jgi:intein-encoded DNA endonuclease-like protein